MQLAPNEVETRVHPSSLRRAEPRARGIRRAGFTLLELLVVLVVIATLAALVAPSLTGSLARGRLDTTARAIVAQARKAKALATAEGRTYLLVIDPVGRELRLARRRDPLAAPSDPDDPEREPVADPAPDWARPVPFGDDVHLERALLDAGLLTEEELPLSEPLEVPFLPGGQSQELTFVFRLEGQEEQRAVQVLGPTGLARVLVDGVAPGAALGGGS